MTDQSAVTDNTELVTLTADIVSAHVANNEVQPTEIATLISTVYEALNSLGRPIEIAGSKPNAAVSVRASIKPGFLLSMIDGKPYKMLKRHITLHGYTPESYREAFDLPRDYPMVAADYAKTRQDLAKKIGLGRKRASPSPAAPAAPKAKPAARGSKAG